MQPSTRAASRIASGTDCSANCRIMKMPNAGATQGTTRAKYGVVRCALATMMNNGTTITANGTASELNMVLNRILLPRKRYLAKGKPASAHSTTEAAVAMIATTVLVSNHLQNGLPPSSPR